MARLAHMMLILSELTLLLLLMIVMMMMQIASSWGQDTADAVEVKLRRIHLQQHWKQQLSQLHIGYQL